MRYIKGILLLLFALPLIAGAHGSGASLEKVVDNYLVDVGYSPAFLEAEDPIRFDFALLESSDRTKEVPFTDIWVRIEKEKKVFFAGGIAKARLGGTGVSYVFPTEGQYELFIRFQNGEESLAETSFPLSVDPPYMPEGGSSFKLSNQLFLGLIAGFGIGFFLLFFRKRSA